MIFLLPYFLFLILSSSFGQISDASFFPSVKSINPSVAHMRNHGFVAIDTGQKKVERLHDVPLGGIIGGIKTEVNLKKTTIFRAGKGPGITFEFLFDKESGEKEETIKRASDTRIIANKASSTYYGGIFDLKYIGVSFAKAKYNYLNEFRIGTAPSISAKDVNQEQDYTNVKVGTAIKIKALRIGLFVLNQKSSGDLSYTYYDPSTGNRGTTEEFPISTSAKGYGVGIGLTGSVIRTEASLERMYGNKLNISEDFPDESQKVTPPPASRASVTGELRFKKIALGVRVRNIKGNYTDLEDLISSNLLYGNLEAGDSRLENTFNFGLGINKGFSFSGFYSTSKVTSQEKSPVFNNDLKYEAVTTSRAYGINLSYVY